MPTNVPPQYRDAEQRFREAVSVQGKIAALQEMLQIMPKHKGCLLYTSDAADE